MQEKTGDELHDILNGAFIELDKAKGALLAARTLDDLVAATKRDKKARAAYDAAVTDFIERFRARASLPKDKR
jgi:hypothetical protein